MQYLADGVVVAIMYGDSAVQAWGYSVRACVKAQHGIDITFNFSVAPKPKPESGNSFNIEEGRGFIPNLSDPKFVPEFAPDSAD